MGPAGPILKLSPGPLVGPLGSTVACRSVRPATRSAQGVTPCRTSHRTEVLASPSPSRTSSSRAMTRDEEGPDRRRVRGHPRRHRAHLPGALHAGPRRRHRRRRREGGQPDPSTRSSSHPQQSASTAASQRPGAPPRDALLCAGPVAARRAGRAAQDDRSVLVILDSSNSMNAPAGDGREPPGRREGRAGRADRGGARGRPGGAARLRPRALRRHAGGGCKDTKLVSPVGPLDRDALDSEVQARSRARAARRSGARC